MSTTYSTPIKSKFKPFISIPFALQKCNSKTSSNRSIFSWPKGMSYCSWKNLSKSHLWFIGTSRRNQRNKTRTSHGCKQVIKEIESKKKLMNSINSDLETNQPITNGDVKLELITMLKTFWDRKNISQCIEETIPDYRNQVLITYSKQSIMMCAIAIFLFRMGSGNKYDDKCHDKDEKYSVKNMAKFINAPEDRVPVIKTIETFLKNFEEKSVNDLMIAFFKDLQRSKFFQQHPQIMAGDFFLLAADCVHTHTYDHPHHTDKNGHNDCEYCLKRVYNKGAENEKVKWIHNTLVFSLIFMGGLKIPIYRYPIHAKQIVNLESASENMHKQECELTALKESLPAFRKIFPKMKIVLLLDGLYANRPVIRLAVEQKCGYIIVRKDLSLTGLAKECNERIENSNHKKNCTKRLKSNHKCWLIEQKYEWFNSMYLGEGVSTNVLRFLETRTKDGVEQTYKCEWLFSRKLSANTCELAVRQARARWEEEDIFNSLKNRGFNFDHDYSRDPRSCSTWQGLALFAYAIFELFRFSEAVKNKVDLPQITLAEKLLGQLLYRPTEEIFSKRCLSKRIQFRYHFVFEFALSNEIHCDGNIRQLKTG
jgi:hypothetical protein